MEMSSVFINYFIKVASFKENCDVKIDSAASTGGQGKLYVI